MNLVDVQISLYKESPISQVKGVSFLGFMDFRFTANCTQFRIVNFLENFVVVGFFALKISTEVNK